jgi:pyruvate,water dikinase
MKYTCWFSENKAANSDLVGEKGANLSRLAAGGFSTPPGFCLTVDAYCYLLKVTGLDLTIAGLLEETNFEDQEDVAAKALAIQDLIKQQPIPTEIASEVLENYFKLGQQMGFRHLEAMPVVVRPSVTAEGSSQLLFSEQLDSYLNVRGGYSVLKHARRCWASLWKDRTLTELQRLRVDHKRVKVAVVVQAMANPEDTRTHSSAHTFA